MNAELASRLDVGTLPPWHPLRKLFPDADLQVLSDTELHARLAQLPRPWVFTNGVFDVLHRGHVSYLAHAKSLGASLILGLNSDASVRGLGKGPERPINTLVDRACVLGALASVDAVIEFTTPTPTPLIARLRPDLYVKGGDYDMERLEETRQVRSWGGQSLALPFEAGHSTTGLVQRLRQAPAP